MKKIFMGVAVLMITGTAFAQMQTVQFNAKKMQFDDGRELPGAKAFIVTTDALDDVGMVKMQISDAPFKKNKILYEAIWKRKIGDKSQTATLPNHNKLRSGRSYNFRFLYYRKVDVGERGQIASMLTKTCHALLQSMVKTKGNSYRLIVSPDDVYASLNDMLADGMINYETKTDITKPAFSSIVLNLLEAVNHSKSVAGKDGDVKNDQMDGLKNQLQNEVEMISNSYEYMIVENITVPDYPVERSKNYLALNVGYGGIYRSYENSNLDYFSGPYVGVSFPLGNKSFSGRFWNNASISAGIYLTDFKVSDSVKYTGPVVKKPIYAAFGYRIFNYLRVHAGTTIVEKINSSSNDKAVYFQPFVGLSLELNIWLGVGKK